MSITVYYEEYISENDLQLCLQTDVNCASLSIIANRGGDESPVFLMRPLDMRLLANQLLELADYIDEEGA
ncbi:hypothetical protein [Methylogaea oryzae]|uniref:Uncharacterized protein n=1 Tax=Methylogaea oryzae TaxID=1295382 RepID=A0A8D4VKW4_9GAMM|nr:hypothetical protein [Methylogaea oryzae]BBL69723.1 hypothetical protein MoryE10_03290 [Methylogaea oryzae]